MLDPDRDPDPAPHRARFIFEVFHMQIWSFAHPIGTFAKAWHFSVFPSVLGVGQHLTNIQILNHADYLSRYVAGCGCLIWIEHHV